MNKSRLVPTNNTMSHRRQTRRTSLRTNFKRDIDKRYGVKKSNVVRALNFGDKRKNPKVKARDVYCATHKPVTYFEDRVFEYLPKSFEHRHRPPIRTRG